MQSTDDLLSLAQYIDETVGLFGTHMPEIDIASITEEFGTRQRLWQVRH